MTAAAVSRYATPGAGGTVPRPAEIAEPGSLRRLRLIAEIGVIFLATPLALTYAIYGLRLPLFLVLAPILIALVSYLLWDKTFDFRRELSRGFSFLELVSILAMFALAGGAITLYVAHMMPHVFLSMPRERPDTWLWVLVRYPLLSVIVQELIYRTFFFHRYGPLFGQRRWALLLASGGLFSFGHIMFYNPVALAGTFVAGVLLAWRYERTRSFWAVWLEHTLYGLLIFTVGLGSYFFTGIANAGWRL